MLKLRPIVINSDGVILGGNQRYKACKSLGMESVWVINADHLTTDQQRKFILRDNIDFGKWDNQIIRQQYSDEELKLYGVEIALLDPAQSNQETFSSRPPLLPDEDMEPDIPKEDMEKGSANFNKNTIKQIVFQLPIDLYQEAIKDMDDISRDLDCDDNSEVFLRLINFYETQNGLDDADNDPEQGKSWKDED